MSISGRLRGPVRGAVDGAGRMLANALARLTASRTAGRPLVVLDIDNTLADSWPSFLRSWPGERERLASLTVLPGVKTVAHDEPVEAGAAVAFVSYRNVWDWPVTFAWLRRNGFAVRWWNLILVNSPEEKLRHLRRWVPGRAVTYWDDLSYGHESGEVRFHADVIAEVERLDLRYHGYGDIIALSAAGTAD